MPKGIYKHKPLTEEQKKRISLAMKGKQTWITKGTHFSETHKKNISLSRIGRSHSIETRKKIGLIHLKNKYWLGKKHKKETKEKLSLIHKGKKLSEETKRKLSLINTGKHHLLKTRIKISNSLKGEKSYNWKGGYNFKNDKIRHCVKSKIWREKVFKRDNWTCQKCNAKSGNGKTVYLHPHHIKNFSQYTRLRFNINNGITLCDKCHNLFHKTFGKKNNNKEQLIKFGCLPVNRSTKGK
jgi:ribosomal protein S16